MRRLRGVCCVLRQVTWSRNRIWNIQFAGIMCIWPLNIYIYILFIYMHVCARVCLCGASFGLARIWKTIQECPRMGGYTPLLWNMRINHEIQTNPCYEIVCHMRCYACKFIIMFSKT
jgi:hypothetical protein